MKYPSPEYSALVERKQNEIRGNVSSVKLTPQECEAEIKAVTGGAKSVFAEGATIHGTHQLPNGEMIEVGPQVLIQPKRRGRPPGSRNKPKPPKGS